MCLLCVDVDRPPAISITMDEPSETSTAKDPRCVGVWVCGRVGVWVCGRVGVWVCGRVHAIVHVYTAV